MINIDELIRESALARDPSVAIYRLIKAEFLRWVKDNPGKNFDEATERKILKKMRDQRKDSLDQYTKAGAFYAYYEKYDNIWYYEFYIIATCLNARY